MWAWLKALFARLFGGGAQKPAPAPAAPRVLAEGAFRPGPAPPSGMVQLLVQNGAFPQSGAGDAQFTVGMIQSFAGSYSAYGSVACTGGTLPIMQNQPLMAVIGLSFGGDGMETLGVPDLHARVAIGGAQVGGMPPGALMLTWLIAVTAGSGAPMLGAVVPFGGNSAPAGWAICDGSLWAVPQDVPLFEAIGSAFGGNGESDFALPDLIGASPVGVGPGMALGQKVSGTIDGLGLNYIINLTGPLGPTGGNGQPPSNAGYAGQVIAYAGAQIPQGWAVCDGSLLTVSAYPNLFMAIGNIWGGDGKSNFMLPDLRGKMMPGR
jgi:microcystin-dependent protein